MALVPILWALKVAPVADLEERMLLTALGEAADSDGCNAIRSDATLAVQALMDARTVRRRRSALEARRLLQRGDQAAASYIPPDRRPVVYDVMVPWSFLVPYLGEIQTERERRGRPPLTPEDRPEHGPAPVRARRADAGRRRPANDPANAQTEGDPKDGGTSSPAGLVDRPDSQTGAGGLVVHDGGSTRPTTLSNNPLPDPPQGGAGANDLTTNDPGALAVQLLTGLPRPWRLGRKTVPALAPLVGAALSDGWSAVDLVSELTRRPPADMARPGSVLRHRLEDLPPAPAVMPTNDDRDPWCGMCDPVSRMVEIDPVPGGTDTRMARCPDCHPNRSARAS